MFIVSLSKVKALKFLSIWWSWITKLGVILCIFLIINFHPPGITFITCSHWMLEFSSSSCSVLSTYHVLMETSGQNIWGSFPKTFLNSKTFKFISWPDFFEGHHIVSPHIWGKTFIDWFKKCFGGWQLYIFYLV